MEEVVRRWQKFVGDDDDLTTFPECVPTALLMLNLVPHPQPSVIDLADRNVRRKIHREGIG